jgi:hypothetical protein
MPSLNQIKELMDCCTYEWTTFNGIKGCRFSGRNGGAIFLPAAGYHWKDDLDNDGSSRFWSSTPGPSSLQFAYFLDFNSGRANMYISYRGSGFSVRPVSY